MTADNVLLYSLVAAVAPVLFYVALIYWVDRYEKEPWWLLSAAFLWGAIPAALLALVANVLFSAPLYVIFDERAAEMAAAGVFAPVIEEVAKALVLFLILFLRRHGREGFLVAFFQMFGRWPFRCRSCRSRFFRYAPPPPED